MSYPFRDHLPPDQPVLQTPPSAEAPDLNEVIPDDLVDAILDGEIDPARREEALRVVRSDAKARARLDVTQRMLSALKSADRGDQSPDFSGQILARMSASKGFLTGTARRRVVFARYAAAAAFLLAVGGMWIAERYAPESIKVADGPAPVSEIAQAVPAKAAVMETTVRNAVVSLRHLMPEPSMPAGLQRFARAKSFPEESLVPTMNPVIAGALWVDVGQAPSPSEPVRNLRGLVSDRGTFAAESWSMRRPLLSRNRSTFDGSVIYVSGHR